VASSLRPLQPAEVGERLRAQFGDDVLDVQDQFGHAVVTVSVSRYRDIAVFLRDDPDLALDFFDFTGAVDFEEEGIEIVTHLASTEHGHQVRLKVRCAKESPVCPTLSDVYPGANWHERETTEMFGVEFEGHPQPVKLLLSEQFEGHPLRKDFPLMTREAKPWPGAVEGEEEEEA
jgi:NADH-quinone oxidoreductase subunit C